MNIWGRYLRKKPEKIDQCTPREANYLLGEYRLAYGKDWVIWAGRRCDEPGKENKNVNRQNY